MMWLKRSKVHCVLQARRKDTEEKLKRILSGQSDCEKTYQAIGHDSHIVEKEKWEEALLMKDQQIFAMQTAIEEPEKKIRDFQESEESPTGLCYLEDFFMIADLSQLQ